MNSGESWNHILSPSVPPHAGKKDKRSGVDPGHSESRQPDTMKGRVSILLIIVLMRKFGEVPLNMEGF